MSKLYIVPTPLGNMEDITLRAINTLKEVDVIACEDTRTTKKLLDKLDIRNKKLLSYHDHNETNSSKGLIALIKNNTSVALVSDAGTPVISDPGYEVIREAIKENIEIVALPGPSASILTLVLSNFDTRFTFHGFLKPKTIQRQNQLKRFSPGTHIIYISPHSLMSTLEDIKLVFGDSINVFLGRELTKMYETHYRGSIVSVIDQVKDKVKGEFTLALEVKKAKENKYAK